MKEPYEAGDDYQFPWGEIFSMLHRMEDKGFPLDISRGFLVGLPRRLMRPFGKTESLDDAFYALEDMRDDPNCTSKPRRLDLDLVVRACARVKDLDRALATVGEYARFGFELDAQTYGHLLAVCRICDDVEGAISVEAQMIAKGISFSDEAVRSLAHLFASRLHWKRAMTLCRENLTVVPPQTVHNVIFHAVRSYEYDEALELKEKYSALYPDFQIAESLMVSLGLSVSDRLNKRLKD